jgi:hypothetical protein
MPKFSNRSNFRRATYKIQRTLQSVNETKSDVWPSLINVVDRPPGDVPRKSGLNSTTRLNLSFARE